MAIYPAFSVFGIELEYMIVNAATLNVAPICDKLFAAIESGHGFDIDRGRFSYSNELAQHVFELKLSRPLASLKGIADEAQEHIREIDQRLAEWGARLLPTAAHPWMDPAIDTVIWEQENTEIYRAFDSIFHCSGHGWSNLQSMHINFPFSNEKEFVRLHAAIRSVLPIIPALSASSPILDGKIAENLDQRLEVYRANSAIVPEITGLVIPEFVWSSAEYESKILKPIYTALSAYPDGEILCDEWSNARGAIARFDRNAIEIRTIDVQECPKMDLAIAEMICALVQDIYENEAISLESLAAISTEALALIHRDIVKSAGEAKLIHLPYLNLFGVSEPMKAKELWSHLVRGSLQGRLSAEHEEARKLLEEEGCLAKRILTSLPKVFGRSELEAQYRRLADCLELGRPFRGEGS